MPGGNYAVDKDLEEGPTQKGPRCWDRKFAQTRRMKFGVVEK